MQSQHRSHECLRGKNKHSVCEFEKEREKSCWRDMIHPEVTAKYKELIKQSV